MTSIDQIRQSEIGGDGVALKQMTRSAVVCLAKKTWDTMPTAQGPLVEVLAEVATEVVLAVWAVPTV